jgi:hypothetical protein
MRMTELTSSVGTGNSLENAKRRSAKRQQNNRP